MQAVFFEDVSTDKIIHYLCQLTKQNFIQVYVSKQSLEVDREKLSKWQDFSNLIGNSQNGSLFDDKESNDYLLLDIGNLELDKKVIQLIKESESEYKQVFFYSHETALSSDIKKELKKSSIEVISLKKVSPQSLVDLIEDYSRLVGLEISTNQIKEISSGVLGFREIIDLLDVLSLTSNTGEYIQSIQTRELTPIFMLPFNPQSPKTINTWLESVNDENMQLALSVIYTKLDKQKTKAADKLIQEIVQTDKNIKTNSKVNQNTWWKLFLWKALKA